MEPIQDPTQLAQIKPASKWPLWLAILVALIALAVISWLVPSYKKVVKDNETLTSEKSDLQQKLDVASKTKVASRTYFPSGQIATEVTSETDTDTRSVTDNRTSGGTVLRSHQETVTKRGMFTMMVYADLNLELAGSVSYQVLGPVNIGAGFAGNKPYLGAGLSF